MQPGDWERRPDKMQSTTAITRTVTPERYDSGMSYDEYAAYVGTPENLARESSGGGRRQDFSGFLRDGFAQRRLTDHQLAALKWLVAQPSGPAKMLVIAEEWSSD